MPRATVPNRAAGQADGLEIIPIRQHTSYLILSAPHISLLLRVCRGTPTLLPYHHCLLNPVSSARQGRSGSSAGQKLQDITVTNREFKYFIQRLNYYLYQTKRQLLKYIATWEKQKRGAIHYHVIFFDFPYIAKEKLQDLWSHGFIKINRIDVDSKENRGRYLSKYFGKELDVKEHKKKAFFKSQNLKMPKETRLMLTDDMIHELQNETIIFQKEYTRQIYDTKSFLATGSYLRDSSVTYIKIKKETTGVRGDSDE